MSKMPAKKKSCFQITSVTQAQVGANSATDDTESLDDPDESRTEDVSSEIFDMSRTDYEPEVCDMSSSEETLNNVCESEGQLPAAAPVNGGFIPRNSLGHQGIQASSAQAAGTSQVTNSSSATTVTSCSSRFRVIKLDHGTGEPFRRGRWTCMEYYEKDTDGSVMSRTVDSIRHTNVTEPLADRDSGLGATVGSVMAQVAPDAGSDGSSFTGPGSCSPETFSNKPVPPSSQQQVLGNSHVAVPHSLHHDGGHPGAHLQKSPSIPPPQLYQPQSSAHHLQSQPAQISAGQPEYTQSNMPTVTQTHPGASLSVGHAVSQGSSPGPTPSAGGMQVLGTVESPGVPGGVPLGSQPVSSVPNLVQHVGLLSSISPISIQQSPVGQYQASGLSTPPQSTQNMPAAPGTVGVGGVPALSLLTALPGSATVPNLNTSAHSQVPRSGTAAGIGSPAMGFSQTDESRRMSDASAQIHSTDMMKPLITEGLQLSSPAVNSLFGISIPIDGEDDRNPSTAFYQAFQSGSRLKDSKMTCDSASGASVVAIDNKIEQAMDLVKSHLMYAVREEVEVLKEQIKELFERNSVLERENAVLKSLANSEQLSQLTVQPNSNPSNSPSQLGPVPGQAQSQLQPYLQLDANTTLDSLPRQPQPNVTSA
ncbi:TSC22 domain family protein 2-like isoform X1 [Rhinichthys klamathensis goyatoka]|uniref:TSC22 domain family protein 2-like isoform X1 n=1 Tax=Rhinichthys klamathensis goyatoka TaxID=3034132 RepID=UPI0024B5EE2F|nr:TSC22 domain family protein 2-like isoform X1 [Rhinichthys klamathensis goyatoka]